MIEKKIWMLKLNTLRITRSNCCSNLTPRVVSNQLREMLFYAHTFWRTVWKSQKTLLQWTYTITIAWFFTTIKNPIVKTSVSCSAMIFESNSFFILKAKKKRKQQLLLLLLLAKDTRINFEKRSENSGGDYVCSRCPTSGNCWNKKKTTRPSCPEGYPTWYDHRDWFERVRGWRKNKKPACAWTRTHALTHTHTRTHM